MTENIVRKKVLRNWKLRDSFDLGIMSTAHGFSDGFSNLMVPVLVLIVAEFSLTPVQSGILLSSLSLSVLMFQYPLSIYSDFTGRRKAILLGGMLLATISYLFVGIISSFYFFIKVLKHQQMMKKKSLNVARKYIKIFLKYILITHMLINVIKI